MSKNLEGIVASIRDIRAKKRPEVEANLQKIDNLLAAIRTTRGQAGSVADHNPALKEALHSISFDGAETLLGKARTACEAALVRLRRDSINIGVAGKARQGKSQILQMLTGLGDKQIPTGDGDFCTATLNIVRNGGTQTATVFYLTETDVLTQMVYPSFAPTGTEWGVGLDARPGSLSAFLGTTYPTSEEVKKAGANTTAQDNWGKVLSLQNDLKDDALRSHLGKAPEHISDMNSVRDFLVKDKGQKIYQTVDHVEIVTPFPDNLPPGMTVYDIPGLEDPTAGIKERMLKTVANDADIVFFLRLPASSGDGWRTSDGEAFDMLRKVYPADEVDINDWVQVILNHWPAKNNTERAESMKVSAKEKYGINAVICDCGKQDEVRQMVDANIDALVSQTGRIDDLRIRQADEAFRIALAEARALYNALASNEVVAQDLGPKFFKTHWEAFERMLKLPFRSQATPEDNAANDPLYPFSGLAQKVLEDHFKKARSKFRSIYEKNENALEFPPELPVFSRKRIENLMGGKDPDGVVDKAVRNQREAVLTFVRAELTKCCDDLMDQYFKKVVEIGFNGNPALKLFGSSGKEEVSRDRIESFLAAVRKSGRYPTIESAAECLRTFNLSFEDTILPGIYSTTALSDFDPDKTYAGAEKSTDGDESDEEREEDRRPIEVVKHHIKTRIPVGSADKRATYLFNWLKMKSNDIISFMASGPSDSAFSSIARYVASAMKANYDAFAFRFIYGDDCDSEWEGLTRANQAVFWKEEYEEASERSALAKEWRAVLADLAAALADAN